MNATTSQPSPPHAADSATKAKRHHFKRRLLMLGIPLGVAAISAVVYLQGGRFAQTDNAYVKADKLAISADVSGKVVAIHARDNQAVQAGDVLFELDTQGLTVALHKAQATLAQARTNVRALQASYREALAQITLGETRLGFARKEQTRLAGLQAKHFVSATQYDAAKQAADIAAQSLVTLRQDAQRIAASLAGQASGSVDAHPSVRAALAEVAQAELQLARSRVVAAQSGVVTHLPQLGQFVATGATSAALITDTAPWIEANFTETDLAHVRPGQAVQITLDIAPDLTLSGTVDSLSPATGAEFALIPAQNATGNWVKIAQRVPVRIRLNDPKQAPMLRAGLSATVRIDTGHRRNLWGWQL